MCGKNKPLIDWLIFVFPFVQCSKLRDMHRLCLPGALKYIATLLKVQIGVKLLERLRSKHLKVIKTSVSKALDSALI